MNYIKVLNIHNFNSSINSNYTSNNFSFFFRNNFNSNVTFSAIKNIRDENYFVLSGFYSFSKFLKPGISIESKRINDNRKLGISRFKDFSFKSWLISNPLSSIKLAPFLGYKTEEQFEIEEKGKTFGLESFFDENFKSSKLRGNLNLNFDELNIRNNSLINSDIFLENFLSEKLYTVTQFYFNRINKDYFTSIDSNTANLFKVEYNIENRVDNLLNLNQRFEFLEILGLNTNLSIGIYYRTVEKGIRYKNLDEPTKNLFDSRINEFKFNLNGEIHYSLNRVKSIFKFLYTERSEKHSIIRISSIPDYLYYQRLDEELQKNNFSSRIILGLQSKINFFRKDTLTVGGSISKLKYDTPSLQSFTNPTLITRDDRDELLYIIRLEYLKFFNPSLQTHFLLESYNNHIVYIYKEKSSNNNWNRVIRLATNTKYFSKRFSTNNYFEVLANYTVFDFEERFQSIQSFAFRQFGFRDSTRFPLYNRYFIDINYNIKLSEQGTFNWKRFSSIPGRFLNEQAGEIKLGYHLSEINFLSIGIRFTSLNEFNFKGKEKQTIFEMNSLGPMIEGFLFYKKDFYVNTKCWVEYISQTNQTLRRNINLSFNSYLFF